VHNDESNTYNSPHDTLSQKGSFRHYDNYTNYYFHRPSSPERKKPLDLAYLFLDFSIVKAIFGVNN